MATIEKHLHEHFASLDENDTTPVPSSSAQPALPDSQPDVLDQPFAKVNTVAAGSPAESAGLVPGDEIRNFGYVNRSNHDNLKKVAECVQGNEGVRVHILSIGLTTNWNLEQHLHQGIEDCGRGPTPRATLNVDSTKRLGWARHVGLPHSSPIAMSSATHWLRVKVCLIISDIESEVARQHGRGAAHVISPDVGQGLGRQSISHSQVYGLSFVIPGVDSVESQLKCTW